MKRNFTKLLSLAVASICALSAAGQEKMPAMRMGEERVASEREIRPRAEGEYVLDSVVMYGDLGDRADVYYSPSVGPRVSYNDYNGYWIVSDDPFFVYVWPWNEPKYDITYNSRGLVESVTYLDDNGNAYYGDFYWRLQFQYNANGYLLTYGQYRRFVSETNWKLLFETVYLYDTYDNWIGAQTCNYQAPVPLVEGFKYTARVDDKGRITYSEYRSDNNNDWTTVNGRQSKYRYYIWYYSDGRTPTIEPENNTPVGDSNKGSFELDINIPSDSINNGSLVITLPEGFTLDRVNTRLTLDFSSKFALKITKQDDNSWLLEITPRSTRSTSLRAADAKTLLNVAYTVDPRTKLGVYDIVVNSILFESKGGNNYPEPAITIPANVTRGDVSNEQFGTSAPKAYIANNTLYIQSAQSEQITVYTVTGTKLYEATGATTIDASAFPQGILIVKGNDWTEKVKK